MTIKRSEFKENYPSLSPTLAGTFYDSEPPEDETTARNLRDDLPSESRIRLITRLLADSHRLMANIERDWDLLGERANRKIHDSAEGRAWLIRIMVVWQEELTRLQSEPI